jgi:DNA primase
VFSLLAISVILIAMTLFTKESLENLRQRIDLVQVLSGHIELKPSGAAYKALCPFHDEKSPSFMISKGDKHYHCFGCGAHGDAIQFLMTHVNLSFSDAVENLASRFGVRLEKLEGSDRELGPNKKEMKEALVAASRFYQTILLHTAEGHEALKYLYERGIDLNFIRRFEIGLAPKDSGLFRKTLTSLGFSQEILVNAGLLSQKEGGRTYEFFNDRITIPICDGTGAVIGFSARKYKENTFGGKYVNTTETALFKKSKILFGFHHSRKRIAKERNAIIVEGQIDALKMIEAGINMTVASQGTAFGEGHAKELISLGVVKVYVAFDSDNAGRQAAAKVGDLFQSEGVEVLVVALPQGHDPDSYLRDFGPTALIQLIEQSKDYLSFLVEFAAAEFSLDTPAGKSSLVDKVGRQIRSWKSPLMVHESLKRLAQLVHVPEDLVGVGQPMMPHVYQRRPTGVGMTEIDPDCILESDLLRWLLLQSELQPQFVAMARRYLDERHFRVEKCRRIYLTLVDAFDKQGSCDLIQLMSDLQDESAQLLINQIMSKKVNPDRAEELFKDTLQKQLHRHWMDECEAIRVRIASGQCSEDQELALLKQFGELKKNPPVV